jgi:predicted amidophosphoribosyltransferase
MPFNVGPFELLVMFLILVPVVVVVGLTIRALTMSTNKRICPVCGSRVKRGRTTCATCQHDFAAAQRS